MQLTDALTEKPLLLLNHQIIEKERVEVDGLGSCTRILIDLEANGTTVCYVVEDIATIEHLEEARS